MINKKTLLSLEYDKILSLIAEFAVLHKTKAEMRNITPFSNYREAVIELEKTLYYPTLNLPKSSNKGYEPWGYAESLVDEWFDDLRDKVYTKDENGKFALNPSSAIFKDIEGFKMIPFEKIGIVSN